MLTRTIVYTDFNGLEREETYYFRLNKPELMEMELSERGGLAELVERAVKAKDGHIIMTTFKQIILKSFGVKSADGKRLEKSEEISRAFEQSPAYEILFEELVTDAKKAADFVNAVIPDELVSKAPKVLPATTN